ncbi:hypothetical protein RCL1_005267 [Eukaryota sp. TZLM3-RCL]
MVLYPSIPPTQSHVSPVIIRSRQGSNFVLAARNNSNGAKLVIQTYRVGTLLQQWFINSDGTIRNAASNLVIDVEREEINKNGASLCLWTPKPAPNNHNQCFTINQMGNIAVRAAPHMVIDIPRATLSQDKALILYTCKHPPGANQMWSIEPVVQQHMPHPMPGQQWQQPMPSHHFPQPMHGQQQWQQPMPSHHQHVPHHMPGQQQQWQQPMPGQGGVNPYKPLPGHNPYPPQPVNPGFRPMPGALPQPIPPKIGGGGLPPVYHPPY